MTWKIDYTVDGGRRREKREEEREGRREERAKEEERKPFTIVCASGRSEGGGEAPCGNWGRSAALALCLSRILQELLWLVRGDWVTSGGGTGRDAHDRPGQARSAR